MKQMGITVSNNTVVLEMGQSSVDAKLRPKDSA